jgi:PadR family transcriptional regulator, regulatory protein PadR
MAPREYLGSFELMVLLALIRCGDDAYGVTIAREIEKSLEQEVALGSVYATLARLEKRRLVTSSVGEPTAERGGRAKRYFEVTALGTREVRDTQRALARLARGTSTLKGRLA